MTGAQSGAGRPLPRRRRTTLFVPPYPQVEIAHRMVIILGVQRQRDRVPVPVSRQVDGFNIRSPFG